MSEEMEKNAPAGTEPAAEKPQEKKSLTGRIDNTDRFFLDPNGLEASNYTGDEVSERDYRPIRRSREYRSGCLGGLMYFVFIGCVSMVLAVFMWMAATDALALTGSSDYTATVNIPSSIFTTKSVEVKDADGKVTGTERVSSADIDYIATELKEAGIIQYRWLFKAFCNLSHADTKIDSGEYTLKGSYDYRALIKAMQHGNGPVQTVTITFPEGFTMRQIFQRLEENKVATMDELYEAAENTTFDYDFLGDKKEGSAERLEGYLFPDTYEFYVDMNPSSAIKKFLDGFYSRYSADMMAQLDKLGITLDQAVTVASIIEKEAGADIERGNIASVIYNRLKAKMSLGLDSTILYVYPDHEGAPNAAMLADPSPYNTRINLGLPPTPISNPGTASLIAALNPTTTNYYYFALESSTGNMKFFSSLREFNAFVAQQDYDE